MIQRAMRVANVIISHLTQPKCRFPGKKTHELTILWCVFIGHSVYNALATICIRSALIPYFSNCAEPKLKKKLYTGVFDGLSLYSSIEFYTMWEKTPNVRCLTFTERELHETKNT